MVRSEKVGSSKWSWKRSRDMIAALALGCESLFEGLDEW
jgi:hypothetical protein